MRLTVCCPIHKKEQLHRLFFNSVNYVKQSVKNKRGMRGVRNSTEWAMCSKCNKPRKIKIGFT